MADIITDFEWTMILDQIEARSCVPFLGAAVNISSNGYTGLPLGEQVALSLVRKLLGMKAGEEPEDLAQVITHQKLVEAGLDKDLARIALKNLPRVALHVEMAGDYNYLITLLKQLIPDRDRGPSKLLNLIAALPFRLVVTTNYDRLLENALNESPNKNKYRLVVQPIEGFDDLTFTSLMEWLPTYDGLIVYKIHGTFSEKGPGDKGKPARIIVTEDDYIQFLTVIGKENEGVPNSIKEKLVDSTLLFLGYSLEDWDFRTLHKGLIEGLARHEQYRSFAIQKDPPEFVKEFWKDKNVTIKNIDVHDFADQLEKRWNDRLAG